MGRAGGARAAAGDPRAARPRGGSGGALRGARRASWRSPGLGGELKPFQRAGVAYLLERRRAFLADEQGLGKTIEALAALEADDAYPAVVVCPANLKLNWLREIERWLPGAQLRSCAGGRLGRAGRARRRADVTVVNYDILARAPAGAARATAPRALVLDESHYCKNAARQAHAGGAAARRGGARARGSCWRSRGTPVVNRPAELIAQLRILGRLQDFGSGRRVRRALPGARTRTSGCTGTCARAASCAA